jgi:hypothetical protein
MPLEVDARAALEATAHQVLGAEAKLDGLKDDEIRRRVLAVKLPGLKLDGQHPSYVEAAFEVAVRDLPARPPSQETAPAIHFLSSASRARGDGAEPGTAERAASAHARAAEEAWRRPAAGTTLEDLEAGVHVRATGKPADR